MNGVRNTTGTYPNYAVDGGVAGVTVTVYAPNGATKTAVTSATGAFSINTAAAPALPAGPYRVEFTVTARRFSRAPSVPTTARPSVSSPTVAATGVDLGVVSPKEVCPTLPFVAINSYGVGTASFASIVKFPYRYSDDLDGNINGTTSSSPSRDATLGPTKSQM